MTGILFSGSKVILSNLMANLRSIVSVFLLFPFGNRPALQTDCRVVTAEDDEALLREIQADG